MKTKVINGTGGTLVLKEGTGGIFRTLHNFGVTTLDYNINVDINATYREYWCASAANDPNPVVLSSDDCQEYKEVTIMRNEDGSYYWIPVRRDGKKAGPVGKKIVEAPIVGELQAGAVKSQEGKEEETVDPPPPRPWYKRIFGMRG